MSRAARQHKLPTACARSFGGSKREPPWLCTAAVPGLFRLNTSGAVGCRFLGVPEHATPEVLPNHGERNRTPQP